MIGNYTSRGLAIFVKDLAQLSMTHLGAFHARAVTGNLITRCEEKNMAKRSTNGNNNGDAQLQWHRLHLGLYARIAKRLHLNPSYVSRVARGKRQSEDVKKALLQELARINAAKPSPDFRRMVP
jgi:transcriptional regulator with XRE-family HTH domain